MFYKNDSQKNFKKKGEKIKKEFKQIQLKYIDLLPYLSAEAKNFIIVSDDNKYHNVITTNQISFGRIRNKDIATIYLGKDIDKIKETGITLVPDRTLKIEEAEYVLIC